MSCAGLWGVTLTPCFAAPEVLAGFVGKAPANLSTAADIWSAACLVIELLTGRPLFPRAPTPKGAACCSRDSPASSAAEPLGSNAAFPDSILYDYYEMPPIRPDSNRRPSLEQQHILQQHQQWVSTCHRVTMLTSGLSRFSSVSECACPLSHTRTRPDSFAEQAMSLVLCSIGGGVQAQDSAPCTAGLLLPNVLPTR